MRRIEIMFSQAIEEDILAALKSIDEDSFYTIIPGVRGRGFSSPKMGDAVWPGSNEIMIIYCKKEAAEKIETCIKLLQKRFPDEGLALFIMKDS